MDGNILIVEFQILVIVEKYLIIKQNQQLLEDKKRMSMEFHGWLVSEYMEMWTILVEELLLVL